MGVADGLSRVPTRLTTIPAVGAHCSDIVCQTFDETDLQSIDLNVVGSTRVPSNGPEHSACSHNSSGMMFAFLHGQPPSDQQTPNSPETDVDPNSLWTRSNKKNDVEQNSPASKHNFIWNKAYANLQNNPSRRVYKERYEALMPGVFPDKSIAGEISQEDDRLQFISEQGLLKVQGISKVTGKLKDVAGVIDNLETLFGITLKNIPQTALPWAIVSSSLQMLVTAVDSSDAFYTGVIWVIQRMDWYSKITNQLLRKENDMELVPIREDLEKKLVELYEEFLFYQIKSVCWFHRNQSLALLRTALKLDDWKSDLESIKQKEDPFQEDMNQYELEQVNSRLEAMDMRLRSALDSQQHTTQEIMSSLFVIDPRILMQRIEGRKDPLVPKVHEWMFETGDWNKFMDWDDPSAPSFLCLNGLAGSGKTMMVIGIVRRLTAKEEANGHQTLQFFFQGNDSGLNSPSALLRCLIWLLLDKSPDLVTHIKKEYATSREKLFEGKYGFDNLSPIFKRMLQDFTKSYRTTIIVDALDECVEEEQRIVLNFLQGLISGDGTNTNTKVLVSGRPSSVLNNCAKNGSRACMIRFEDNDIGPSMNIYIDEQSARLNSRATKLEEKRIVDETIVHLRLRAKGMFHWTSLMLRELEKTDISWWELTVATAPTGIMDLYGVIFKRLETQTSGALLPACKELLALVVTVYRPLTRDEISLFLKLRPELCFGVISACESFLTMQNDKVYPIHHTAQQYLQGSGPSPLKMPPEQLHSQIFRQSLEGMRGILKRDIYGLSDHCIAVQDLEPELMVPNPNPLGPIKYSCRYWAQHLQKSGSFQSHIELINKFFHEQFLHWLEAMGLLGLSGKVSGILDDVLKDSAGNGNREIETFVLDAKRFVLRNLQLMETVPLQVYISALIFSPQESLCRLRFHREFPVALSRLPKVGSNWGPLLRTFDNCEQYVAQFSPDGELLATASMETINILSTTEWDLRKSLKLSSSVRCVAFSPQKCFLAAGSDDGCVVIWDTTEWKETHQWKHSISTESIGFSSDNLRLFGWSYSERAVWSHTPEVIENVSMGMALSPSANILVTFGDDQLTMTDTKTLNLVRKLPVTQAIRNVCFSADGKRMVAAGIDTTWLFKTKNWANVQEIHVNNFIRELSISRTGRLIAGSSMTNHIDLIDVESEGLSRYEIEGFGSGAMTFSPTQDILASAGFDELVRVWDTPPDIVQVQSSLSGDKPPHCKYCFQVVFSPTGQHVASRAWGSDIILWDAKTGSQKFWLNPESADEHVMKCNILEFSLDGEWLLCWSYGSPLKVWSVHSDKPELEVSDLGQLEDQAFFDEEGLVIRSQDRGEQKFSQFRPGDNGGTSLPDFERPYTVIGDYIVDSVSGERMI
ncbi:WD40 repeat-like protein [Penicillium brevicompactum]|uniref:WD40 repeat-like protein n=1 Tax=Penicillium brevicompactum TaxID=5074 RepID=UPI0025416FA6|nr:WD40 repeat-like protein [Penicillium brevicompactum]KAJ5332747.1 WD40 repeat-like protein [Penicillium brevicompactum]